MMFKLTEEEAIEEEQSIVKTSEGGGAGQVECSCSILSYVKSYRGVFKGMIDM